MRPPPFEDMLVSLDASARIPAGMVSETREVMALGRRFAREVVRPRALELDARLHEDPDHLDWEFVKTANEWGLYSMWLPKFFGGGGYNFMSMAPFIEEVSSQCLAMANLIGVHYLGVGTLSASWNAQIMRRVFSEVAQGEKTGEPCLISLAITEPSAGTDAEEVDLMDRGEMSCRITRCDGGYKVNGTKIFISNGHLSTWHMTMGFEDLSRPSETAIMLAVKTGTPGFSFGRIERKMGQKACPASVLVFDDCFVPDELVALDHRQFSGLSRSHRQTTMQVIDYVVSTSRAGVGAFGAGAARGAYEEALAFASETEVDGTLLVNHEWAQCLLAEMYKNVSLARLTYMETNYANALYGFFRLMGSAPFFYSMKYAPRPLLDRLSGLFGSGWATRMFRQTHLENQLESEAHRTSGWASLCKFTATDLAVKNGHLALELMGQAGLRHDRRVEKHLRDAKLLQIYEGTNQLNRLNLFKCMAGADCGQAEPFCDCPAA
ncbi:MAG: acyl-CoA/acyl-ACP dehydrogenase [Proteobacteria bacterium]|nr:acyl-CoA/acyl-ACP dehydrogenase [Pseudomonadota bacterium]